MPQQEDLNIVLTGMPGAGKTFIGEKLAKLVYHFKYVDIDKEIEKSENMNISEIFEEKSEKYFRELETKFIKEFSKNKNQIISIGGGAFENEENIKNLKLNGICFYLKTNPEFLYKRLSLNHKNVSSRPMLNSDFTINKLKNLLKKREKNYQKADFTIDTEGKQAYTIIDEILKEYHYARK